MFIHEGSMTLPEFIGGVVLGCIIGGACLVAINRYFR